jgi:hypothetical protein
MSRYSLASVLMCLTLMFAINAFGLEKKWIPLTGNSAPAKTQIIEETQNSITIEMKLNGFNVEQKIVNGKSYQFLSVPMSDWMNQTGKPKLPVIRSLIVAPSDGDIQINIEDSEHIKLTDYNVYPVGKQIVKNGRNGSVYVDEEFTINNDFYATDDFYPQELARVAYSGYMREQRLVQLEFHPIMYHPLSKELLCYSFLRVRLTFKNSLNTANSYQGLLRNVFDDGIAGNVSMAPQSQGQALATSMGFVTYPEDLLAFNKADYVIIASEPFYSNPKLKQLAEWRANYTGLDVAVVPTEKLYYKFGTINVPDTSIKAFVQYAYTYWKSSHSPDGHIKYVLLVGDTEFIPIHISDRMSFDEYIATDNWYACVNGDDLFPDVMLGRLPAKNLSELGVMVDKIVQYEQNPLYGDWANNALLMLGTVESLQEDLDYARDEYLTPDGYNTTELDVLDGQGASDVVSELNKGKYIVDYAGHGYIDKWEILNASDVAKLKNNRMLPAIFSLACSTGYFDYPDKDSLAEAFVKSRNGAIAFFGSSRLAAISSIGFGLSEAIAGSHLYNLGEIAMHAKLGLLPYSTDLELYNLIGDPALDMGAPRRRPNISDIAISPSDINFKPEAPKQGEQVMITATIANFGDGDANNVVVEFYDGGPNKPLIEKKNLSIIRSGEKVQVNIQWELALGVPQHNIYIKAYTSGVSTEYYEENNDSQKQLIVSLEKEGWPIAFEGKSLSAPVTADINGDGKMEIIFQSYSYDSYNSVYVLDSDGKSLNGWSKSVYRSGYDYQSQYNNSSVGVVPSVGDLDRDGKQEIVGTFFSRDVYAWKYDGTILDGWPVMLSGNATASPILADVDMDGNLDVIVGTINGQINVLRYDGSQITGWPVSVGKMGHLFAIVVDLDGDSDPEIVAYDSLLPKNYDDNRNSNLYAWHHDGTPVKGWPVQMKGSDSILPPVAGDLDGDGKSEVIAISNWSEECRVYIWNNDGSLKATALLGVDDDIRTAPALADIDGDGDIEIIATTYDGLIYAWHHDGRQVYGWPVEHPDAYWLSAPVFADIDGDDKAEVVATSHGGIVYAYEADGTASNGWPAIISDQSSSSPPAIADIDGDTKSELVCFSNYGDIHALSLTSNAYNNENSGWVMLLHDQRHTGSYGSNLILPSEPTNIQASDTADDKGEGITISWQLSTDDDNAVAYVIFRSDKVDGKYVMVGKVERGINTYADNGVKVGVTYWYMVRTSNGANLSANTNPISAYSFNNFAPQSPTSLYVYNVGIDGAIGVWWTLNVEPDMAGYKIYSGTSSGVYDNVIDVGLINNYMLTALTNGKQYFACITSYDTEGNESLKSKEIFATPQDDDTDPPVFSSFNPSEVAENTDFYVRCDIQDQSDIYDNQTPDDKQGIYLIWDIDGLSENSHIASMSKLPSGGYVTDKRIPGQSIGTQLVYKVVAYDNDYDWNNSNDRTKGVSVKQIVKFISAPQRAYNYPNPAPSGAYTDRTIFRYYVDSSSQVTINIYSISGYLVESLEAVAKGGGYSETEWNISNVASGIYPYTIEIQPDLGERQIIKNKLAILK